VGERRHATSDHEILAFPHVEAPSVLHARTFRSSREVLTRSLPRPREDLVVRWDRACSEPTLSDRAGRAVPAGSDPRIRCLWACGAVLKYSQLDRQEGLPAELPIEELVAELYARWGTRAAERLMGPTAWIIWDGARQRLVAARDRLGTVGLYYAVTDRTFLLAQRLEPLLARLQTRSVNECSVVRFLHGKAPLDGQTFYEGVGAVKGGSVLTVSRDRIDATRYWSVGPRPALRLRSDAEYAEALRDLLLEVVAEHAAAGPLGVTLSGGMDSTSVAAAARAASPESRLTAFTWQSPELPQADESRYSTPVCEHLAIPAVTVRADLHWPLNSSETPSTCVDSPFHAYYADLWDATFQAVRRNGISVLLSGMSGDHLFGGDVYAYPDLLMTGRWLELMGQLRDHLPHSRIGLWRILRHMVVGPVLRAYLPYYRSDPRNRPEDWLGHRLRGLYHAVCRPRTPCVFMLPGRQQRLQFLDVPRISQIVEEMNIRASEHGVEFRHPLLDHRLVEFALRLPTDQTFRSAVRKGILRRAMGGRLPDCVLEFRGKITPEAIFDRGARERERRKIRHLLTNMRAADLRWVDEQRLRVSYEGYVLGKHNNTRFWHAMTLEAWLRQHF
jgi:asparagine synthase (glutamine-hydrolysing)